MEGCLALDALEEVLLFEGEEAVGALEVSVLGGAVGELLGETVTALALPAFGLAALAQFGFLDRGGGELPCRRCGRCLRRRST